MLATMSQPVSTNQDWDQHVDLPVGEILRRARMHYGQSLEDIARIIRIRASQLEAIEQGQLEQLPGRVYAIGFVRSYSEYLGLDGDQMVHLFKRQSVGSRTKPELTFPVPASESKLPNLYVVGGSVCGVILLLALWGYIQSANNTAQNVAAIPEVPDHLKVSMSESGGEEEEVARNEQDNAQNDQKIQGIEKEEEVVQISQTLLTKRQASSDGSKEVLSQNNTNKPEVVKNLNDLEPASSRLAAPIPKDVRVVVEARDDSWVEIRSRGRDIVISQVFKAGDRFLVPDQKGLALSTGNAGALRIYLDGKALPELGKKAQVRKNISLNPRDLKKMRAPER